MKKPKIVYIEDDEADFLALKRALKPYLNQIDLSWVNTLNSLKEFKESGELPTLLLLDYQFPGCDAIEIIQYFRGVFHEIEIAMLTAYQEKTFKDRIKNHGINSIFNKNELDEVVKFILDKQLIIGTKLDNEEEDNQGNLNNQTNNIERRLMMGAFLSMPDPILFLDINFDIFFKNPAFEKLIGKTISIENKTNFFDLVLSNQNQLMEGLKNTINGESVTVYFKLKNQLNNLISIEASCSFIPKDEGSYCLLFKNIKTFKKAKFTSKTKEYYHSLVPEYLFTEVQIGANPRVIINQNYLIIYKNILVDKLLNNSNKKTESLIDLFSPRNSLIFSERIHVCINEPISFPLNINNKVYETYINPISFEKEDRLFSVSFINYHSNLKNDILIFDPIKNSNLLIESSNSIIFQLDKNGNVIYISRSYETITGFLKHEVLNQPLGINQNQENQKKVKEIFAKLATGELQKASGNTTTLTKNKITKHLRYHVESILDHTGSFMGVSGVFTDVTEAFQTTKALKKTEDSLKQIFNNINELFFGIDDRTRISFVTPSSLQITGYAPVELIGGRFLDFIHPNDIDFLFNFIRKNQYKNNLSERKSHVITIRFKNKNGIYTNLETLVKKVENSNEEKTNYIGTARSVDEKIAADFSLRQTKKYLEIITLIQKLYIETKDIRKTFGILLNSILEETESDFGFICEVFLDEDGNPYMRSNALTNIAWDKASNEFYEKNVSKGVEFRNLNTLFGRVLVEKKLYISNDAVNDPFASGTPPGHPIIKTFVGIPIFKNNEMVSVLGLANNSIGYSPELVEKIQPLLGNIGSIIEQNKIELEITKTQNELAKSEAQVKAILTSIEDIVFEINEELVITNVWAKDPEKLVVPKPQFFNQKFESLIDKFPFISNIYKILLEVAEDGIERTFEYSLPKNNTEIWNNARIFVLTEEPHKTFCLQISDITNTKIAEENLKQNLIQEKELTELKSRFVTLTSHEFRTPLTSISSSNELISMHLKKLNIPINDKLEKYIQIIQSEVMHMSNLLNDVLVLGKIDARKMDLNLVNLNLKDAVVEIMENLEFKHKIPRIIKTKIKGKPYSVMIDIKLLEHILENITNNAFKYSPGSPDPILELNFQSKQVVLVLQDFGIGIPKLEQPKLFEQFYRATNVGKIQGVGLGLVIVKNMVEMLQGNLRIESEEGKGTRVEIAFNK
ncbi:MAG: PAS domain S-box protein [Bacteroidia bacterium]|nr:PAS domain S-box protein [Bacteroidia bacterium]MCF8428166.1 PAS domain S-box protein [Bacteroidia bacterium]MCF8445430.1 PAS domain S-box protein [Bacteroidia bacterium]